MKSRIPASNRLSRNLEAVIQERVAQRVEEEFSRKERDYLRRILKLVCVQLNRKKYGNFGAGRLGNLVQDIIYDVEHDSEVLWAHTDKILAKIGISFQEDYDD